MENEIHIRSKNTGRYWSSGGSWAALRCDARNFPTTAEAKTYCLEARLTNAEIVVVRDALICMRVPVSEEA
jgi:hypothetical protein